MHILQGNKTCYQAWCTRDQDNGPFPGGALHKRSLLGVGFLDVVVSSSVSLRQSDLEYGILNIVTKFKMKVF